MPIFMKFGGEDLNDAFLKIDSDLHKLSSANEDSFLKTELKLKDDIGDIGGAFIKLGESFSDLSEGALKIDAAFIKLAGGGTTTTAEVGGAPNPQADFLALDTTIKMSAADLKILGADFLKLDTAPDLLTFKQDELTVSGEFQKIATDMSDAGAGFLKLGTDLVALGTGPNSNSPQFNEALKILGSDFENKISPAFDALAFDWHKLSQDFANLAGGGGTTTTTLSLTSSTDSGGPVGSDFLKLEHDFLLLNQALGGTAPDLKAAFDALADQSGKPPGDHDQDAHFLGSPGGGNFGRG
jgi:hypothetical protein